MSGDQRNHPQQPVTQPAEGQTFRIDATSLRRRNRNTAAGFLFAGALCWLVSRSMLGNDDNYNKTLLGAVIVTIVLLGLFQLAGHVRLQRRSKQHQVVVGEDRIVFRTGEEETVLLLTEVLRTERQKRMQEGPSLLMRLRNGRFLRLEGYERQEELTDLVIERFAATEASRSG